MHILLINWAKGENDPFSYLNRCLKEHFYDLGRDSIQIELDNDFQCNLTNAIKCGIDFAVTWQGIGSNFKFQGADKTIWEELQIPLICLHSDHPSQAPHNHLVDSSFIYHNYQIASYGRFAAKYLPRTRPPLYVNTPLLAPPLLRGRNDLDGFLGDYFVFPKNLDNTSDVFSSWKTRFSPLFFKHMRSFSQCIIDVIRSGKICNHHGIVDELLLDCKVLEEIKLGLPAESDVGDLVWFVHQLQDKIYRNALSEIVVESLSDFPIKIIGRGWDKFRNKGNRKHTFAEAGDVSDGNFQFKSNYGVLDVAPVYDSLHDRTLRAIANRGGFLIGSDWNYSNFFSGDFSSLFFSGSHNDLVEKAENVINNPLSHREISRQFGVAYRSSFTFYDLLKHFESLGRSSRGRL